MPSWFLVIVMVCVCFAFVNLTRPMRNGGLYIFGAKISPVTMIAALIVIVAGFGIMVAIQLGFVPDHAP